MSVIFLAECKKFQKNEKITALGSVCRKFTHFPSVKFPGLKMCECKKMTNIRYAVGPVAGLDGLALLAVLAYSSSSISKLSDPAVCNSAIYRIYRAL